MRLRFYSKKNILGKKDEDDDGMIQKGRPQKGEMTGRGRNLNYINYCF